MNAVKLKCIGGMNSKYVKISKGAKAGMLKFSCGLFKKTILEGTVRSIGKESNTQRAVDAQIGNTDYRTDMQGIVGVAELYIPIFVIVIETSAGKEREFRVRCKSQQLAMIRSWIDTEPHQK